MGKVLSQTFCRRFSILGTSPDSRVPAARVCQEPKVSSPDGEGSAPESTQHFLQEPRLDWGCVTSIRIGLKTPIHSGGPPSPAHLPMATSGFRVLGSQIASLHLPAPKAGAAFPRSALLCSPSTLEYAESNYLLGSKRLAMSFSFYRTSNYKRGIIRN